MPTEFYPAVEDDKPDTADPGASDSSNDADDTKDEATADEGETSVVPMSMFKGRDLKPGDTCTFKVVRTYDDEVEISYADSKEGEDQGKPSYKDEISMMDQKGEN